MKTSRRTFVKAGTMAALGTALLPGSVFAVCNSKGNSRTAALFSA